MDITTQLAEALRALFESPREGQCGVGTRLHCGELKLDEARLALAAYDAQRAEQNRIASQIIDEVIAEDTTEMQLFTLTRMMEETIEVRAMSAQAAYDRAFNTDSSEFYLNDCQWTVYDANGNDVSEYVNIK